MRTAGISRIGRANNRLVSTDNVQRTTRIARWRLGAAGERATDEGSGAGQAGGRLQRQDPRQVRRLGRRARQRQDVDEPLRRDRRRGGAPPEGEGQGDRDRRRLDRPGARRRRRSAPRSPWAPTAASWSRPTASRRAARRRQAAEGAWSTPRSPASSSSASRRSTTTATRPARCWPRCSAGRRRPSPPSS